MILLPQYLMIIERKQKKVKNIWSKDLVYEGTFQFINRTPLGHSLTSLSRTSIDLYQINS